jgi:hypothetical protein
MLIALATTHTLGGKVLWGSLSAGLAGLFCSFIVSDGTRKSMTTSSFLELGIEEQRALLKDLLLQQFPEQKGESAPVKSCCQPESVSPYCTVCLEDVNLLNMSLVYSPCGHRCVCDDCDRDLIVIKLSSCVEKELIASHCPIHVALKKLLGAEFASSLSFPRAETLRFCPSDRCITCHALAARQYVEMREATWW